MIANDVAAVERLAEEGDDGLDDSDRYRETVDELPDEPALLVYLDLRGLLAFAERSGLAEDTAYTAVRRRSAAARQLRPDGHAA